MNLRNMIGWLLWPETVQNILFSQEVFCPSIAQAGSTYKVKKKIIIINKVQNTKKRKAYLSSL